MKSRTSFFNPGVLKKDILRFSPLWGMYTVFMLLYLFLNIASVEAPAEFAGNADGIMQMMGAVNVVYGGLAAMVLFGDLFKSRLCNALHAMPLRREGWFFTHLTAGLLFCVVPNLLGAVITAVYLGAEAYLAWLWLAVMLLEYLCFFGIGVYSVQLAGNMLGTIAGYIIINVLSVLVAALLQSFYEPVLYGINLESFSQSLFRLSPANRLTEARFVEVACLWDANPALMKLTFRGYIPEDWVYLFAAAGAGLVFLGAGLGLYRKRDLEKAGDFLAVRAARPVFLLLYTLIVGDLFYLVGEAFHSSGQYILLVVGFAVGFFTGWMLLEKRVKVFTGKRFLALGVLVVTFFLTIGITWLDPLGITRYIPESGKVESVTITPYISTDFRDDNVCILTEPEDIDAIRDIHRQLTVERDRENTDSILTVKYKLKNGATMIRQYELSSNSPEGKILKGFYSRKEVVMRGQDIQALVQKLDHIVFESHTQQLPAILFVDEYSYLGNTDPKTVYGEDYREILVTGRFADDERVLGLLSAIEQDCRAGNMAQPWAYHREENMVGYLFFEAGDFAVDIRLYPDCVNTLAYLKSAE